MSGPAPRVLHIVPALFGTRGVVGGAERYASELARHMADLVPTTLLSFGHDEEERQDGALAIRVIGRPWWVRGQRSNPFSARVLPAIRTADVVHCHQQHVLVSSVAAAAARLLGRRVVCTDLGGGGWDVSAYVSTDAWYHGHLHLSQYSRRVFGHDGRNDATVVYGGVDGTRFSPGGEDLRGDSALFVGRILPHKGLDDLVDALEGDLSATIVGPVHDTAYRDRLAGRASGRAIEFRHDCSDDDIIAAYRRALCVVLPSVYRDRDGRETTVPELLGQTVLEGMACGAPAVVTRVASLPELVEHGVNGLIVPPNDPRTLRDALCWLRRHPGEARRMGDAGRRRVLAEFSWRAVVERCLEWYGRPVRRAA